jgi:hypothetical protein
MASQAKQQAALKKAKAAKQKKILIGLAPVFLLVMVFMGPGLLKQVTGGSKPAPPPVIPPDTGDGTAAPAPAPGTGPAPSTATPAPGTATTAAPTATNLDDTDDLSSAGPGQLVSFDRFVGRDPFQQGIKVKPADTGGAGGATGGTSKPPTSGGTSGGGSTGGGSSGGGSTGDAYTKATIEVNGVSEEIAEDGTFPQSDPIFRLVKVTKGGIQLGLVSGEFNAGDQTIAVKKGKTVTLVSQPDGLRYVIKLVSVG